MEGGVEGEEVGVGMETGFRGEAERQEVEQGEMGEIPERGYLKKRLEALSEGEYKWEMRERKKRKKKYNNKMY